MSKTGKGLLRLQVDLPERLSKRLTKFAADERRTLRATVELILEDYFAQAPKKRGKAA